MASSMTGCTEKERRNLYIDVMRGVCISLVMLLHYSLSYHLQVSPLQNWIGIPTLRAILYNGNYGVDIFFVISGFLITSNVVRRYGSLGGINGLHFYKLRFFRLYPLVMFALMVITALGLAGLPNFSNLQHGTNLGGGFFFIADLSVLTFWHNLLMEAVGYFNYAMNIYWSLSVEEVFYLLYPVVLLIARRRWQLGLLACVCMAAAPVYRYMHKENELFFMYGNIACIDLLAYGCVAAIVAESLNLANAPRRMLAALSCGTMGWVYMRGMHGNEALGATWLGMATALFLIAVSRLPASSFSRRCASPLAWLGSHSYELYLFHIIVLGIIVELVPRQTMAIDQKLPVFALFFALSALLAGMTARFFGNPMNQWLRSRFARSEAKPRDSVAMHGVGAARPHSR
ncbi:acyltransferase [Dyella jejuensis]|uniref:Acyltransferase n=1 Tax=Dyella jejuensis TaxID=1432009 RepID=A0ABW8JDB9_9GAMM